MSVPNLVFSRKPGDFATLSYGCRVFSHPERVAHHSEGSPQAHPGNPARHPTDPSPPVHRTPPGFHTGRPVEPRWGSVEGGDRRSLVRPSSQGAPAATLGCDVPLLQSGREPGIPATVSM